MSSALAAAICRIFVGVVLLAAFIAQRRTRTSLRLQQINGYRIVPTRWQPLVLAILAATESLVGFLLLIGCWQPWAQAAATALLLLLAGAMTQALVRGLVTECGCFGSLTSSRVRPILVVRNVVLVGNQGREMLLHHPVLQGVIGQDRDPATDCQGSRGGGQEASQHGQLVVDRDPERLEGAFRRVSRSLPGSGGNSAGDDLDELS